MGDSHDPGELLAQEQEEQPQAVVEKPRQQQRSFHWHSSSSTQQQYGGGGGGGDGCTYSTQISTQCRNDGSGRKCETIKRVFRRCPGRPLEEVECTRETTDGDDAPLSDAPSSFSIFGSDNSLPSAAMDFDAFADPSRFFNRVFNDDAGIFGGMFGPSLFDRLLGFGHQDGNGGVDDGDALGGVPGFPFGGMGWGGEGEDPAAAPHQSEPPSRGVVDDFMRSFFGVYPNQQHRSSFPPPSAPRDLDDDGGQLVMQRRHPMAFLFPRVFFVPHDHGMQGPSQRRRGEEYPEGCFEV
ncbi:unnamed protein product [Vitrella brassicaformis CCMP3155]|uniref:Uncharacterized protein n=3 Tax=Vitrella brassicaformis TaxID=1169539 RepID=A0A0G4EY65_VITBC|nr:unnamed protein product [Vitrella brassicaformis CCMP3155]|eukprot:CEM04065.1 unnamed protein product [Vitrella brassicaformis CCMP3155]